MGKVEYCFSDKSLLITYKIREENISTMSADQLKAAVEAAIDSKARELNGISRSIWENPELNFNEHHAHKVLTGFLENEGFSVQRGYKDLATAFRAEFSTGEGPNICVICEYDALPNIGHACGHNLIAEAGIGAALGLKAAMTAAGGPVGKLTVLGTPAEEGGGGKVDLIAARAFDDVDVAMMTHPSTVNFGQQFLYCLCISQWTITYHGRASHASAFPWDGVNALDAAVLAYNNISCLRQSMKPAWRVHGVISEGGVKPNIIPDKACLQYYLRAPTASELATLEKKARSCFTAAAEATGCEVEITQAGKPYLNLLSNGPMEATYTRHVTDLGITYCSEDEMKSLSGSTDMGNVSYVVPSIHPCFSAGGPPEAVNHSKDFTAVVGAPAAQPLTLKQCKAMALTALDLMRDKDLLQKTKQEFAADCVKHGAAELRSMISYKD